jgi:hypothetical protein
MLHPFHMFWEVRMKPALVLLSLVVLSGCQTPPMTAADVQRCTVVNDLPAQHERHLHAPPIGGRGLEKSCLRALLHDGSVAMFDLYHVQTGREWSDLKSATDDSGKALPLERLVYGTSGSTVMRNEIVRVELSRRDLDTAARGGGMNIHIHGGKKSVDVTLPAYYVQGFLAKVDATCK